MLSRSLTDIRLGAPSSVNYSAACSPSVANTLDTFKFWPKLIVSQNKRALYESTQIVELEAIYLDHSSSCLKGMIQIQI